MSSMSYRINSSDLNYIGSVSKIIKIFVSGVTKRLHITPGNALVDRTIINPEQAYSSFSTST